MANEQVEYARSYKSENDLSAASNLYRLVEMSGQDQIDVCDNAADIAIGVLQNKPKAGEAATIALAGKSKVLTDGTVNGGISVGSYVGTNAVGKGVRKTASGDRYIGTAEDPSTVDGVIIGVRLEQGFIP